jgi:hypothetical protein
MPFRSVPASPPHFVDGAFWLLIVEAFATIRDMAPKSASADLLSRPAAAEWFDTRHD